MNSKPWTSETKKVAETVILLNIFGLPAVANYNFTQVIINGQDMIFDTVPEEMRCSKLSWFLGWLKLRFIK